MAQPSGKAANSARTNLSRWGDKSFGMGLFWRIKANYAPIIYYLWRINTICAINVPSAALQQTEQFVETLLRSLARRHQLKLCLPVERLAHL